MHMQPLFDLPHSKIDPIFAENILWEEGLKTQALFTKRDLSEAAECQSFSEVSDHMQKILKRSFFSAHLFFILGPITPKEGGSSVEENLMHFLCAYHYHCRKEGRRVFPQFLYTPIISHLAQAKVLSGESWEVVGPAILHEIYKPLFDYISNNVSASKVSGYWLEGYDGSQGALWELEEFRNRDWGWFLPQHQKGRFTKNFYTTSVLQSVV